MIAGAGLDVEFRGSISITGTPGVGKTTLSACLSSTLGIEVFSIESIASETQCFAGFDETDKTSLIDVDCLQTQSGYFGKNLIIEGHLSHYVPTNVIIILRCHPQELQHRLEKRGYLPTKIQNNVEWEMIGGVWTEIQELEHSASLLEFDTTNQSAEGIAIAIIERLSSGVYMDEASEVIDWLDEDMQNGN